ncbi:MAG TPA: hypothetical protein VET89_06435 [Stellaceae bacterium]|jgi:hypothetical protein|nr:hypothetical protein [Stellaceae bacterium]
MLQKLWVGLICGGLAACAVPSFMANPNFGAPPGDLRADRHACNRTYPPRIGNYLPHAECVNAAVERDAIPTARYPDLVRLQEQLRVRYSAEIDRGTISPRAGERKMAEADELVEAAIRERDAGRMAAADHRVDRLEAMLQR